ncbi:hypothetical protein D3872_08490 [Massilia cavernae]|uniref:Uncharacterized protein n=2 Tax=Massilia cavernae TaxID=2320864 RepID=A0A418Y495_9BURK|nr:hypothetical protein D3872_08490 [Massilia cavernae]
MALLSAAAAASAGAGMTGISEQVSVDTSGGKVVVKVAVDNQTGKDVYVPKAVFEDKELVGRVFEIRESGSGKEIDYIGRMVKRGPMTMDDYVALKPGKKKSNSIDITNTYHFKPGQHTYTLSYSGSYLTDASQVAAPMIVKVMPVTFSFRK